MSKVEINTILIKGETLGEASLLIRKDTSVIDYQAGDTIIVPDLQPKESTLKETATVVDIFFKTLTSIFLVIALNK